MFTLGIGLSIAIGNSSGVYTPESMAAPVWASTVWAAGVWTNTVWKDWV